MESGKIELTAKLLRKISKATGIRRGALLEINPNHPQFGAAEFVDVYDRIPEEQREQVMRVLEAFATTPKPVRKSKA